MIGKIKKFFKSDKVRDELSAWSLIVFTGVVFSIGALVIGAAWWVAALTAIFGGVAFWLMVLVGLFVLWGIVGD